MNVARTQSATSTPPTTSATGGTWLRPLPGWALLLLLVALVASRSPKIMGDGREHLVYGLQMASGHFPPLSAGELNDAYARLRTVDPHYDGKPMPDAMRGSRRRGWDFLHFWGYSLLATPGIRLAGLLDINPVWSFIVVNAALFFAAWRAASRRFGVAATLLVCASPIVWWIDKIHTEVFTFSLLTLAVASLSTAPAWGLVAIGWAATQNPPAAALCVPFAVGAFVMHRAPAARRRIVAGLAGAVALLGVHVTYNLVVHRTPSLLATVSRGVVPSIGELGIVLWDSNVGLLFGHPLLAPAVIASLIAALWIRPQQWKDVELWVAVSSVLILLPVFTQTTNFQHGATPGLSRYALWLIPFALRPIELGLATRLRSWLQPWAVLSAAVCAAAYHPTTSEWAYRPSTASLYLWTHVPAWVRPHPEIFTESVRRWDGPTRVPTSTPGCEKTLMRGGAWPIPCFPAHVPEPCRAPDAFCYASLTSDGYTFDRVPRSLVKWTVDMAEDAWPANARGHVRRALSAIDWRGLRDGRSFGTEGMLKHAENIGRYWHLQSDRALVVVVRETMPSARLHVGVPRAMRGTLVDLDTGAVLAQRDGDAVDGPFDMALPPGLKLGLVVWR